MCPSPVRMVLSRSPRNMKAKKPPTSRSPATPPPTMSSVITVRRRLRNTLRNASSKNLPMAASFQGAVRFHVPVGEPHDAGRVLQQPLIVGGKEEGETEAAIEVAHQVDQLRRVTRVQVGGWLVGQHQRGTMHDGARHGHALAFATREQVG